MFDDDYDTRITGVNVINFGQIVEGDKQFLLRISKADSIISSNSLPMGKVTDVHISLDDYVRPHQISSGDVIIGAAGRKFVRFDRLHAFTPPFLVLDTDKNLLEGARVKVLFKGMIGMVTINADVFLLTLKA